MTKMGIRDFISIFLRIRDEHDKRKLSERVKKLEEKNKQKSWIEKEKERFFYDE